MSSHSTSALFRRSALLLCLMLAAAPLRAALPDAQTYGARLEAGDVDSARAWLDEGLPVDFVADRIGTGLMIGAWLGDLAMVKLFLARGADVNKANNVGEQALMHAAWRGHLAAVDLLLAAGAQVNAPPMRWSALHYAVFAGHREVAARLIARGADINARSTNGSSVLMMAVYEGHEALAKDLIARGADRAVTNDRGESALDWAFKFRRLGLAHLVAPPRQFAAAASRPASDWGTPQRSATAPALPPAPDAAPAEAARDEALVRIAELERIRATLAARGMADAVRKLDRRIALLREALLPAPQPARSEPDQRDELAELLRIRAVLAERGLDKSVQALDRRIATARARRARVDLDLPAGALLEISASRAAPEDQRTRLLIDAGAPPP